MGAFVTDATSAPLKLSDQKVLPEWIDFNGHMNVAYYVVAFDHGVDGLTNHLDIGPEGIDRRGTSTFTLEMHINYLKELNLGDPLRLTCQLLDFDAKCIHYFFHMYHAHQGYLAATCEQMLLHVDLAERRSCPFPNNVQQALAEMMILHRALPRPEQAGHAIGIRRT
ncbi:MAG: thioesterase family protein [Acidimicrobiales bacterium]|nr:thioesterase family protein [Acidimicrobiales bacterium]